jgi:hypothetical protein
VEASGGSTAARSDVCQPLGHQEQTSRSHVIGGSRTTYNRAGSLFHICEGFGAPDKVNFSPAMKCAILAAAATFGGPGINVATNRLCSAVSIVDDLRSGNWLGIPSGAACGYFADIFAGGVGVFTAGATAETGPGAVAVGVTTYRAMAAGLKIACGGLLDGGAKALGIKIEAAHERHVALDVLRRGKCLSITKRFGQLQWAATSCRGGPTVRFGRSFAPYQHGLGAPHPTSVDYGGDGTADMNNLRWRNWGGREAFATGTGRWLWPGQSVATGSVQGTVQIVVSNIRRCHGSLMYTRMVRWIPQYGERYHPEQPINLCGDSAGPGYVPRDLCSDVQFPDGTAAKNIGVTQLSCDEADNLILGSPAETYLRRDGGRYMQSGYFCGTDGYPDPDLYTPDPGPNYGCGLDQQSLSFDLVPSDY